MVLQEQIVTSRLARQAGREALQDNHGDVDQAALALVSLAHIDPVLAEALLVAGARAAALEARRARRAALWASEKRVTPRPDQDDAALSGAGFPAPLPGLVGLGQLWQANADLLAFPLPGTGKPIGLASGAELDAAARLYERQARGNANRAAWLRRVRAAMGDAATVADALDSARLRALRDEVDPS